MYLHVFAHLCCNLPGAYVWLQWPFWAEIPNKHVNTHMHAHARTHTQVCLWFTVASPTSPKRPLLPYKQTWGRGWMTKASGVGERRKGRGELRRDCHHRVAALFVPTRMQQWYIDIWYITMIYIWGRGQGGALSREKSRDVLGEPRNTC